MLYLILYVVDMLYVFVVCCLLQAHAIPHTSTSTRIKSEAVVKCKMSNQEEISGRFAECRVLSAALQC